MKRTLAFDLNRLCTDGRKCVPKPLEVLILLDSNIARTHLLKPSSGRWLRQVGVSVLWPVLAACALSVTAANVSAASFSEREDVKAYLIDAELATGMSQQALLTLFSAISSRQNVLDRISKPAEKVLTWKDYQPIFIKPKRISGGREFMQKNAELLAAAEQEFGVPAEIIAAIIGVETFYGRLTGKDPALESLATLAFDYPPRAKFFKSELTEFLLLSVEEGFDPLAVKGSYAAAMGMPQFISSSYRHYAIDFDGDGRRDLWNSTADAVGSVGNYLKQHGWVAGDPIAERVAPTGDPYRKLLRKELKPAFKAAQLANHGVAIRNSSGRKKSVMEFKGRQGLEVWVGYQNFYAITRYNHSSLYAMAVYELSEALR